jgi:predicted AlkP superfamily pyrophosphatase or phosphodiesterase
VARGQTAVPAAQRHVLVVSIDGLGASWLTNPPANLRIPNLRRLMAEGSYAHGVVGVYPSVTYPSHTTIVTGRMPAEHGIYSNLSSREAGKNTKDWYWYANSIKVPTLWDVARENKLATSAIFWPVTTGGPINWNIPEIWDPQKGVGGDPLYIGQFATPGLLFDAALELGKLQSASDDVVKVKLAAFVLKKHKPNLLMLHLTELDGAQHRSGPGSEEAVTTLEKQDQRVGELIAALEDAGLSETTDLFVVSDHGFFPVERMISPNVLLAQAGLVTVDEKGNITGGKVFSMPDGGSFFVSWPESQDFRAEVEAALKPLRDQGVLYAELGRSALSELGVEPAAQLALEAPSGAAFDSKATGEIVRKLPQTTGTHGYLPHRRGMHASFIARGPHIKEGVVLRQIPMTAIAPTLLKALGIEKGALGKHPPLDEIFK